MVDYENVWVSITAYVKQQMDMIVANGLSKVDGIGMIDWEDHANIEELPPKHLVGPASLAVEEESQNIYRVSFTVGLGSFNDQGLFKHRKMITLLSQSLSTGKRMSLFDAATSQPYSWIRLVDGTTVAPMSKSKNRAFQVIQAEALVDPMA
ncbi:MAG: hypothetical protein K5863_08955 [Nitratireductor sp.]|uniref:hypothetical protein n=1 Tax=Nitratireductor sp. TaxID=1872084 RepID=UPI00262B7975|nr:hypothetical protein [Nitratireductor sp.]MCV0350192.1 hypothetical protein [Nitratireductor sp.]